MSIKADSRIILGLDYLAIRFKRNQLPFVGLLKKYPKLFKALLECNLHSGNAFFFDIMPLVR